MYNKSARSNLLKSMLLVTMLSLSQSAVAQQVNMLFLGNSFTFRHELPLLVKKVFEEGHPGMTVNVTAVTYGGQNMFMHSTYYFSQTFIEQSTISTDSINARIKTMQGFLTLTSNPPEYQAFFDTLGKLPWIGSKTTDPFSERFGNITSAINKHKSLLTTNPKTKWDYVVLQSWMDEYPSLDQGYALSVKKILKTIQPQGAKVILYITAPDIQNSAPVTGPQEQAKVDSVVSLARRLADSIHPYAVVPVPLAINMLQKGGTNLTFCYVNDFHPNNRTAYLTSNMFYAAFFKQSTEGFMFDSVRETKLDAKGLDPDGGPALTVFRGDEKLLLQRTAFAAVMKFDSLLAKPTAVIPATVQRARSVGVRSIGNNIYAVSAARGTQYMIFNISGKRVRAGTVPAENARINLSSLTKGMYVMHFASHGNAVTQKLIVR